MVGLSWSGAGQGEPAPECKPLTYFGVTGCVPEATGECLRGYHKQAACPSNPMIKAPCRLLCVADAKSGKKSKGGKD